MDSHYYHHDNHSKRHKYVKRVRWFGWGAFLTILLVVVVVVVYLLFFVKPEVPAVTSSQQTSVVADPISVFRSPYFQFEATNNWVEIATDDKDSYLYRATDRQLTHHDLQITVNPTQPQQNIARATRVQVIAPENGRMHPVGEITESCSMAGENIQDNDIVTFHDTTFKCVAGGALFDVLVSEKAGDHVLMMERPDGTTVSFIMYYRDLRANPDGRELKRIVETFETR